MNMFLKKKKNPIFSLLWSCPYYSTCSSVSLLKHFTAFSVCVCACAHTHLCTGARHSACAEVRGQPVQVSSLLLPGDPKGQTEVVRVGWRQVPFPAKPSHLPSSFLPYNWTETKEHHYWETLLYRALIACSCVSSSACLHWGHSSEFCLQEQPCSWGKKQAHLLTACCKSREAPSSALLGNNANSLLWSHLNNSLSPHRS